MVGIGWSCSRNSVYRYTNYRIFGNVENYGNPANIGRTSLPGGYEDVDPAKLSD